MMQKLQRIRTTIKKLAKLKLSSLLYKLTK